MNFCIDLARKKSIPSPKNECFSNQEMQNNGSNAPVAPINRLWSVYFRSSTNLWERYGEGAHFLSIFNRFWRHVRQNRAFSQSVATENASPFRSPPGNPEGFQGIGPSHQKRYFFDGLKLTDFGLFIYSFIQKSALIMPPSASQSSKILSFIRLSYC